MPRTEKTDKWIIAKRTSELFPQLQAELATMDLEKLVYQYVNMDDYLHTPEQRELSKNEKVELVIILGVLLATILTLIPPLVSYFLQENPQLDEGQMLPATILLIITLAAILFKEFQWTVQQDRQTQKLTHQKQEVIDALEAAGLGVYLERLDHDVVIHEVFEQLPEFTNDSKAFAKALIAGQND